MRLIQIILVLLVFTISVQVTYATIEIPFELYSTDNNGRKLDGQKLVNITIFDAQTGGNALFNEQQNVQFSDGLGSFYLGSVNELDTSLFNRSLFVQYNVSGITFTTRMKLGSSPYAVISRAVYLNSSSHIGKLNDTFIKYSNINASGFIAEDGKLLNSSYVLQTRRISTDGGINGTGQLSSDLNITLNSSYLTGTIYDERFINENASISGDLNGVFPNFYIPSNSIILSNDTSGEYVAVINSGLGINVSASGEGSTPQISVDTSIIPRKNIQEVITSQWQFDEAVLFMKNIFIQGNLSYLNVSNLQINGSLIPPPGFDILFDLGGAITRWRTLFIQNINSSEINASTIREGGNTLSSIYQEDTTGSCVGNNFVQSIADNGAISCGVGMTDTNGTNSALNLTDEQIDLNNNTFVNKLGYNNLTNIPTTASNNGWSQTGLVLYNDSAAVRIGTATDAATNGDLSSGLTGASRMFYDQSAGTFNLYDAAGNLRQKFTSLAGTNEYDMKGAYILGMGGGATTPTIDLYGTTGTFNVRRNSGTGDGSIGIVFTGRVTSAFQGMGIFSASTTGMFFDASYPSAKLIMRAYNESSAVKTAIDFNPNTRILNMTDADVLAVGNGRVTIGTTDTQNQQLRVVGNANISGTIYYGALSANSPMLERTTEPFVATCTTANDGELVVEYVRENVGTYSRVIEAVSPLNLNWWHQKCYEKDARFDLLEATQAKGETWSETVTIERRYMTPDGYESNYTIETVQREYTIDDIGYNSLTRTAVKLK